MATTKERSETRFESVFNHVNEGILIVNDRGEIVIANPKCRQLFGYTEEELKGQLVETLVPTKYAERHVQHRNSYMDNPSKRPMGKNLTLHANRKDGTQFPVEISLSYYNASDGMYVIAFIIDITERYEQQEKISRVNQELKLLNETLEKKVNERTLVLKEALHDLEHSRDDLERALEKEKELNEMKSRFISMASHEFRTPLSTILSSISLISKYTSGEDQDKREKHVSRVKNAVIDLREILNDFLSLEKLEQGKMTIELNEVNACDIVDEVVNEMQGIAKNGQIIHLKRETECDIPIDPHIFRNVLLNLLANAIKFSNENSEINVIVTRVQGGLEVSISDHGIGISKEDQKHLFERFFRGKNATNIQGTGLGLNIVLKYLELMDATIRYESELGVGTTFYLFFPSKRN